MKTPKSILIGYFTRAAIMAITFYFPVSLFLTGLATGEWLRLLITCFAYFAKQNRRTENKIKSLLNN